MTTVEVITDRLLENFDEGRLKNWLGKAIPDSLNLLTCIIFALITWYVGVRVSNWLIGVMKRRLDKSNTEAGVVSFLCSVVKAALYVLLVMIVFNIFGVATSTLAAAVASMGLATGLALQGSLSNFAGGVLILVLKPFVVGDYIVEDTHNNEGTVKEISIFYTKLITMDHKVIVIPNGTLANSSLTNVTTSDKRRIDLIIPISYSDDIKMAKEVLNKVIVEEQSRLENEDIDIFVDALADSSVNMGVRFWVPTGDYWHARWRTIENIKLALDEAGITIPFNQIDVHIGDKP